MLGMLAAMPSRTPFARAPNLTLRLATGLTLCGLAVTVMAADGARAQAPPALPFPAPPPSSTEALAGQLVVALYPADATVGALGIAVAVAEPPDGSAPDRLAAHFADALEVALRRHATIGSRVAASALADEALEVSLAIEQGQVIATGKRVRRPQNLWQRLANPAGEVVATAFSAWPLDLELRTLLGLDRRGVRLDALRVVPVTDRSSALTAAPILDLLVEDLDGDTLPELAVLQPLGVRILAWRDGGFSVERARFSFDVVPPNQARVRQAMGRLVAVTRADGSRLLLAASSDRAGSVALTLARGGGLTAIPVSDEAAAGWPLYATGVDAWLATDWPRGLDVLRGVVDERRVAAPEGGGSSALALAHLDALGGVYDLRAFGLRAPASPTWSPHLVAAGQDATLHHWTVGAEALSRLPRAGTVAVVVDLDGDGDPELLTTSDGVGPADRLSLHVALAGPRGPRRVWTRAIGAPVSAAASGDVDRDGYHEFIVATWDGRAPALLVVVPRT